MGIKSKNLVLLLGILGIIFIGVGSTYAFFSYYQNSTRSSNLLAGDVYLNYTEGIDTITLTNAFPETMEEAITHDDNYVTFTINGTNTTTNKDIYYEVLLNQGTDLSPKTRFRDNDLHFELTEIIDGVEEVVVEDFNCDNLDNARIFVNTVPHNTNTEIERTYRLRMWLSDKIIISDTLVNDSELWDENNWITFENYINDSTIVEAFENGDNRYLSDIGYSVYRTEEFENSYASAKVAVYGDFEFKEIATDAIFFEYQNTTFYDTSNAIINTDAEVQSICRDYMLNTIFGGNDYSDAGDGFSTYCQGTGTWYDNTFIDDINEELINTDEMEYLVTENIIMNVPIIDGIEITGYNVDGGLNVRIPSYIDELPVIGIVDNAFRDLGLNSVTFTDTIRYIGEYAFSDNNLTRITIPTNVKYINYSAFKNNSLVYVDIKGNSEINRHAFYGVNSLQTNYFKYGGTCDELNNYERIFDCGISGPPIITSDTNTCIYTNHYCTVVN